MFNCIKIYGKLCLNTRKSQFVGLCKLGLIVDYMAENHIKKYI
jgi:hypothetical protein